MEIYLHDSSDVNRESPCHPLKIFKLFNEREERSNNVQKTTVIFPQIFHQTLVALLSLLGITKGILLRNTTFFNYWNVG